jgi:hypothetical protein
LNLLFRLSGILNNGAMVLVTAVGKVLLHLVVIHKVDAPLKLTMRTMLRPFLRLCLLSAIQAISEAGLDWYTGLVQGIDLLDRVGFGSNGTDDGSSALEVFRRSGGRIELGKPLDSPAKAEVIEGARCHD